MGYWASRGLRGSTLENLINSTNSQYDNKGLALVQKIPTPITPLKIDNKTRTITSAYFEQKSTVDFIGVVQGIAICFDAKETNNKSLPLKNIHEHQIEFMQNFENQQGIAFLIIYYKSIDKIYYVPFRVIKKYFENSKNSGGRKSIPYDELDEKYIIKNSERFLIHYLETINVDLDERG